MSVPSSEVDMSQRSIQQATGAAHHPAASRQGKRLKILLVEDDRGDVVLLREMLARAGARFELVNAARLDAACAKLRDERFDIVLLDLSLEDSQGIETFLVMRLHALEVPVVVLTGLDDERTAVRAVREGAQDYLVKGRIDGEVLVRAIRYAIERQRALTELKEANQRIADFTAMIVHDLRSPLVNVIAIGDMISDGLFGPLGDEQKKWLGRIVTSGHKLVALVTNFLDLSKLEAGRIEVAPKALALDQLLSAIVDSYQLLAAEKNIALRQNFSAAGTVDADADRVEQVLINLLSNALKFTPPGGAIEIGTLGRPDEAEIWVQDSGPGIARDEIGQLFEKYKQTSSAKLSEEKGTGLGLLICKMIVEAHGGRIRAESEPGYGARFSFTLPR